MYRSNQKKNKNNLQKNNKLNQQSKNLKYQR